MHQKRNGVQVGVVCGVGVGERRDGVLGAAVEGDGTAGSAAVAAGSGALEAAGTAVVPLFDGDGDGEAERVVGFRAVDGAAVPTGSGAEADVSGCGTTPPLLGSSVAGAPAPGGTPSLPLAANAATPRPTTARPSTETTIRPGRRAARREPVPRPLRAEPRTTEGVHGSMAAESGSPEAGDDAWSTGACPEAGAPQPAQVNAPFRWRRQGTQ
ncbi:hypothetical protein ACWGB8_36200 [Kitasatospora sp. NPDC054939]